MSQPEPAPVAARICEGFILAGGRSSRMGQDKALVRFKGVPLIQHAIEIVRAAGLEPRVAGARSDLSSFAPILADDPAYPDLGPLSGICPALEAASARFAVFIPVDQPLLPPSLVGYLVHHAQITDSAVTLASLCGFIETFPAVIDRAAGPILSASLRSGSRKCLTAFQSVAETLARPFSVVSAELLLQAGQVSDPSGLSASAWFQSMNHPEDLSRAEGLLNRHLRTAVFR